MQGYVGYISGLVVSEDSIRRIIKLVDPQGVELRRAHRLRRRPYRCRGPNALWHMDGYDKLKPCGIAINGCIDGFSRCVLWMAYTTNSDPKVVASYFIKTVPGIVDVQRGFVQTGARKMFLLKKCRCFCEGTTQTVLLGKKFPFWKKHSKPAH
ncbi:hypothetical protein F7725_022149 [Dissostichus mawsoni]|uniref:Integrase core domain-containing protein n=1 Tax=Dissostichus mawsoni TaxID=36200 RepID=A0A7J5ZDT8_DISMA|nr:hypothetical protein F7725_022149 [Dissostichus mawsoni]